MKATASLLLGLSLALALPFSPASTQAQEEGKVPYAVGEAVGGLSSVLSYNAQIAVDRIVDADVSTADKLRKALQDLGGMKGGLGNSNKVLAKAQPNFSEVEQGSIQELIDLNTLILEEIAVVIEMKRAESEGNTSSSSHSVFQARRDKVINKFDSIGFDKKLFE